MSAVSSEGMESVRLDAVHCSSAGSEVSSDEGTSSSRRGGDSRSSAIYSEDAAVLARAVLTEGQRELPFEDARMDVAILTGNLERATEVAKAAEQALQDGAAQFAECMGSKLELEKQVDSLREHVTLCSGALRSQTAALHSARDKLEVCHGQLEDQRAESLKEAELRNGLEDDLARANEEMESAREEANAATEAAREEHQQLQSLFEQLQSELEQAHAQIEAGSREASREASAARMREEALEERVGSLQQTEKALRAELQGVQEELKQRDATLPRLQEANQALRANLRGTKVELAMSEKDLREELATVYAELGELTAELQRRQKCCGGSELLKRLCRRTQKEKEVPVLEGAATAGLDV